MKEKKRALKDLKEKKNVPVKKRENNYTTKIIYKKKRIHCKFRRFKTLKEK